MRLHLWGSFQEDHELQGRDQRGRHQGDARGVLQVAPDKKRGFKKGIFNYKFVCFLQPGEGARDWDCQAWERTGKGGGAAAPASRGPGQAWKGEQTAEEQTAAKRHLPGWRLTSQQTGGAVDWLQRCVLLRKSSLKNKNNQLTTIWVNRYWCTFAWSEHKLLHLLIPFISMQSRFHFIFSKKKTRSHGIAIFLLRSKLDGVSSTYCTSKSKQKNKIGYST